MCQDGEQEAGWGGTLVGDGRVALRKGSFGSHLMLHENYYKALL